MATCEAPQIRNQSLNTAVTLMETQEPLLSEEVKNKFKFLISRVLFFTYDALRLFLPPNSRYLR